MKNILTHIFILVVSLSLITSCDFLDVVPPEQPSLPDATQDADKTLGFLHSCYTGINGAHPTSYTDIHSGASTDEYVLPVLWNHDSQRASWNLLSAPLVGSWYWGNAYRFIGQSHLFQKELADAIEVTPEEKKQWNAEADFLIAYYHFTVLRYYGPCPINDAYIDMSTSPSAYGGRSHYDYVTDYIVDKLDKAIEFLPPTRSGSEWGRATSTAAKALKARVLLYAASPLWNGNTMYANWKNTNFETPEYGKELVSQTYDPKKWERALAACKEALDLATGAGNRQLYSESEFDELEGMDEGEEKERQKFTLRMRYAVTARDNATQKNKEWILATANNPAIEAMLPQRIVQHANGNWYNGYSGISPTLYTVEHFYTKNGKLPEKDPAFFPKSDWFKRANSESDIIKLNTDREPRFYAWLAFDGGEYGTVIRDGEPIVLRLRDPQQQGYNPAEYNRNHCVTGYLNQKFLSPQFRAYKATGHNFETVKGPQPIFRLAELYLNYAECLAETGKTQEALVQLNIVRERAGVPALTMADVTNDMPIREWVRNERFVELWNEGHRYYDVRRWKEGKKYFSTREGLNPRVDGGPSFEVFNQRTPVDQPFVWDDRMYLGPIYFNEVYKNPQMIQSPGY